MSQGFLKPLALATVFALVIFVSTRTDAAADRNATSQISAKVRFNRDVQPIFDANCVACHQTGGAHGNLNLEAGYAYRAIVSRPSSEVRLLRVNPGKPEKSYLFHKLSGTHLRVGGSGARMPATGPLDRNSIDVIRRWISEGARSY